MSPISDREQATNHFTVEISFASFLIVGYRRGDTDFRLNCVGRLNGRRETRSLKVVTVLKQAAVREQGSAFD